MPDNNAGLDGITMRGVLSISFSQEVGMLRKAWIIDISAAMASPFYVPPEAVGMPANHGRWPERAHRFSESNCASCPKPCKRNDCSIVGPERLLLRDSKRLESGTTRTRQARTQNVADDPSTDVRVGSKLTQRLQKDLGLLYGVAAS